MGCLRAAFVECHIVLLKNRTESALECLRAAPLRLQLELNLFQIGSEFVMGQLRAGSFSFEFEVGLTSVGVDLGLLSGVR